MVNNSYGYFGFSGIKCSDDKAQRYGPEFGKGDIVGCGIIDNKCFFTKNGDFLGVAFREVSLLSCLFPTVGLYSEDTVKANFGQHPFRFNLDWQRVRRLCALEGRQ